MLNYWSRGHKVKTMYCYFFIKYNNKLCTLGAFVLFEYNLLILQKLYLVFLNSVQSWGLWPSTH